MKNIKKEGSLSERLRETRLKLGFTQKQISEKLNIEIGTLSGYETGRRKPNADMLKEISRLYNVSIDYLLENETNINDSSSSPSKKRPKELIKLIEQEEYTLNGKIATQEDREKLAKIIEALYWDAKEKNKRK